MACVLQPLLQEFHVQPVGNSQLVFGASTGTQVPPTQFLVFAGPYLLHWTEGKSRKSLWSIESETTLEEEGRCPPPL